MQPHKKYTIATIGGDGIGPELVAEAVRLLQSTNVEFAFVEKDAGYVCFKKTGTPLPQETIDQCRESDAILFGAVTTPARIKDYCSPIVQLRRELDLYANVRPIFSLPVNRSRHGIDFVLVRENTEGLYVGDEQEIDGGFVAKRVITKKGCQRILRFAFELAKKQNRKTVTAVHKANILRLTDGLFLETAHETAKGFDGVAVEDMLVDAAAMRLIKQPEHFDVVVTTNMFGDILSDAAAMLVGGLGVVGSASIGDNYGLFEPVHGSAPKYQGTNRANPVGIFFAACMMLEFLGEHAVARQIHNAIKNSMHQSFTTPDIGGTATTMQVTDALIKNIQNKL